jgi:poly(A) polymerase Pap1
VLNIWPPRYLGVTRPITTAESNPREKEVTVTLMEELRRQKTFENDQEARTRYVPSFALPSARSTSADIINLDPTVKLFWERLPSS